jgi:hypothetical protein
VSRKRDKFGVCHICGRQGKLSPEHVPPKAAFNNARMVLYTVESWIAKESTPKGRIQQGGINRYTLCAQCNNDTGSWYGSEYVSWAKVFMALLPQVPRSVPEIVVVLQEVYPLRFLKQVVTCFFSLFPDDGLAQGNPDLVKFVLDRQSKKLPSVCAFYLSLYRGPKLRQSPISGLINLGTREMAVFSEIAHPPFALVMTHETNFKRALKITNFALYDYDEKTNLILGLKVGEGHSPYPGDYHVQEDDD